jgi:hypothetical protein
MPVRVQLLQLLKTKVPPLKLGRSARGTSEIESIIGIHYIHSQWQVEEEVDVGVEGLEEVVAEAAE